MGKFIGIVVLVATVYVFLLPIMLLQAAIGGWVLSILWNWFIPVIFEGAPRLTVGAAVAVALIVGMLTKQIQSTAKEEGNEKRVRQAVQLLWPFIYLVFGWVVRWWFF